MVKIISKIVIGLALVSSSLLAETGEVSKYQFDIKSLVGIEAGYSSFDVQRDDGTDKKTKSIDLNHGGVKIGAESESFRLFLSARAFDAKEFKYARSYGVELQYLLNFSKYANLYFGAGVGKVDMKLDAGDGVKFDDTYYSGDVGFNIHLGEIADWEIGARVMGINGEVKDAGVKYKLENIVTGYTSIIFKFKMD